MKPNNDPCIKTIPLYAGPTTQLWTLIYVNIFFIVKIKSNNTHTHKHTHTMAAMDGFEGELKELREVFKSGKTREASWRRAQLQGILSLFKERESDILKALNQDLGKHHVEAYRDEIGTVIKSANYALGNLKKWMASKSAKLPLASFPASAKLVQEPLGVVLIISAWNFPFGTSTIFTLHNQTL
ncbi:putative aldehyde dehydrogenase (NAD(P)(+)) [Helianthus annuus]|nr:putative aldehyde dehydrogenase (NAD(P)(+)) [Helianthus annuus]